MDMLFSWLVMRLSQEALLKELGGSNALTTPALDDWVEQHGPALERAFLEIKSVQDRRVHVPPKGTWNSSIVSCPFWCFRYICSVQQLQHSLIAQYRASLSGLKRYNFFSGPSLRVC